jgi:hypothetical protein
MVLELSRQDSGLIEHIFPLPIVKKTRVVLRENSLAVKRPDLAKEWHPTMNGGLSPNNYMPGSEWKAWWQCLKNPEHPPWQAEIRKRAVRGDGCRYCSRQVTSENSLAVKRPDLAKEWHPTKNGNKSPTDFAPGSEWKAWWQCLKTPEHPPWQAEIRKRAGRGDGCRCCFEERERLVLPENSLAIKRPDLTKEFDHNHPQNEGVDPYKLHVGTKEKVGWKCENCNHSWCAQVRGRAKRGYGCPGCSPAGVSRPAIQVASEIFKICEIPADSGMELKVGKWNCDMVFTKQKLIIEYDGARWHGTYYRDAPTTDKRKTKELQEMGYNVIRIREYPLPKITKFDLMVKPTEGVHSKVSKTLEQILIFHPEFSNRFSTYKEGNKLIAEKEAAEILAGKRRRTIQPL